MGRTQMAGLMLAAMVSFAGCSMEAPKYNPNYENVEVLRSAGLNAIRVGAVTQDPAAASSVETVSVRLSPMASPYGTYSSYLQAALRQELDEARLLDPNSPFELTAQLRENSMYVGLDKGRATVVARFVVKRGDAIVYDAVKSGAHEWDSAFLGMVAIPKAQQEYPGGIQNLLAQLYADKNFIAALRK